MKTGFPVVTLLGVLAGCVANRPGGPPDAGGPAPPSSGQTMSTAGESLLTAGSEQRRAGDLGQAAMTLERALRIEPRQPALWLELALVRLDEGNFAQAEQLARKAGSLAPADSPLMDSIDAVIDEARRRQGIPFQAQGH